MKLEQLKKMIREIAKKEMNLVAVQSTQKSLKLESASRTAMEIGGLTGLNKDVVQKFVDTHNLDIEKVFQFVKKGKLSDRMDFVTAVSGKPNNPIQKKLIKKLQESVNEAKKYDIGSGYLGNGLTIWNRAEKTEDDDYETIAHIGKDGKLTIYDKEIPADIKKMFGIWATSMKKGNRPGSY